MSSPGASAATSGVCRGRIPKLPSTPGSRISSHSVVSTRCSGVTISTERAMSARQRLRLLHGLVDVADHVEGLLGQIVVLAVQELLEGADGVVDLHVLALEAGELLGHVEGLAEEALDLAGAGHRQLVVVGQLVH